jgi:allantoin racemase
MPDHRRAGQFGERFCYRLLQRSRSLFGTRGDGIAECGILTALTLGHRFGVISILAKSVPRHLRYVAAMGVGGRLAADLPIGLGVTELGDARTTMARMTDIGCRLRDAHGADVLVMGCAGMARYRDELEAAARIPVVEPTQAAVAMALGRVRLGWGASLR